MSSAVTKSTCTLAGLSATRALPRKIPISPDNNADHSQFHLPIAFLPLSGFPAVCLQLLMRRMFMAVHLCHD